MTFLLLVFLSYVYMQTSINVSLNLHVEKVGLILAHTQKPVQCFPCFKSLTTTGYLWKNATFKIRLKCCWNISVHINKLRSSDTSLTEARETEIKGNKHAGENVLLHVRGSLFRFQCNKPVYREFKDARLMKPVANFRREKVLCSVSKQRT